MKKFLIICLALATAVVYISFLKINTANESRNYILFPKTLMQMNRVTPATQFNKNGMGGKVSQHGK